MPLRLRPVPFPLQIYEDIIFRVRQYRCEDCLCVGACLYVISACMCVMEACESLNPVYVQLRHGMRFRNLPVLYGIMLVCYRRPFSIMIGVSNVW